MNYIPDDLLSALLGQTELIAGVAAALVVFIVILVIACKCNLFNKVCDKRDMIKANKSCDHNFR